MMRVWRIMPQNGDKLKKSEVLWLADNNYTAYRMYDRPAPAETEVSTIIEAEIERIRQGLMHEHGVNIYDAPDQELVRTWIGDWKVTDGFYKELEALRRIYSINQIVSILWQAQTSGEVTLRVAINKSEFEVVFGYRQMV